MLVIAFLVEFRRLGFTSSRKRANRFLLREPPNVPCSKKRETHDDFRCRGSVGGFGYWRVGRERGRVTSLLNCSLGELGRRLPEKGLQPAHPGSNSSAFTSGFRALDGATPGILRPL